jgi:hypothetical protein
MKMLYHRLHSPTQTNEVAKLQEQSMQILGLPARGSDIPTVKAYVGPLPKGSRGVEFYCDIDPENGSPPGKAYWYLSSPGVILHVDGDKEFAMINVSEVRIVL